MKNIKPRKYTKTWSKYIAMDTLIGTKKLKELCKIKRERYINDCLDNLVVHLLDPEKNLTFVKSNKPPESTYEIPVNDRDLHITDTNTFFTIQRTNDLLGPNEEFLVKKILYSTCNLLLLIGGIGVGKTSFLRYFVNNIVENIETHNNQQKPFIIEFDFLKDSVEKESSDETVTNFTKALCYQVESKIARRNFFTPEEEITSVWLKLLENDPRCSNRALNHIVIRLRDLHAKNQQHNTEAKRHILHEIRENTGLYYEYIGALLGYIRNQYYSQAPGLCLLIFDNIDRFTTNGQRAIIDSLNNFHYISQKTRIIIPLRQSTYYQRIGNNFSSLADKMPYTGPDLIEILTRRFTDFERNPSPYINSDISADAAKNLISNINEIIKLLKNEHIKTFIRGVCGRSVRKGLKLGQYLIYNSIYGKQLFEPTDKISISSVIRALIVANKGIFQDPEKVELIENLYEIESLPRHSACLLKLRILKILKYANNNHEMATKDLIQILKSFGYSEQVILESIKELSHKMKRLIYCDSVREFSNINDLTNYGNANLKLTSIGQGYEKNICKELQYIQEIMLDTKVNEDYFEGTWDYDSSTVDRLTLLYKFCDYLVKLDISDVQKFMSYHGIYAKERYLTLLSSYSLITEPIIKEIKENVNNILNSSNDKSMGYLSFKTDIISNFESLLNYVSSFEVENFHKPKEQPFNIPKLLGLNT